MARKTQKLINYHGTNKANLKVADLNAGEIAIVHNGQNNSLIATLDAKENGNLVYFVTSGAVESAIKVVKDQVDALAGTASGDTVALEKYLKENYATSADTVSAINDAASAAETYIDEISGAVVTYVDNFSAATDAKIVKLGEDLVLLETNHGTDIDNVFVSATTYADACSAAAVTKAVEDVTGTSDDTADKNTIHGAKAYADDAVKTLSGDVSTEIEDIKDDIQSIEGTIESDGAALSVLSGEVVGIKNTYITETSAATAISAAKTELKGNASSDSASTTIAGAKKYADQKDAELKNTIIGTSSDSKDADTIKGAKAFANTAAAAVEAKVDTLSGAVETLSGNVVTYIDTKVSSAYIYKGTVTNYSNLPESGKTVGYVYNVTNAKGNPGDSDYTPAGTNYAWNGTAWDALGGTVDLSNYATTETTDGHNTRIQALEAFNTNTLPNTYETKTDSLNKFNSGVTFASAYTDSKIAELKEEILGGEGEGETDTIAKLREDLNKEVTDRTDGDNGLDDRLDVIEGEGAGSIKKAQTDAQSYADQKDADLKVALEGTDNSTSATTTIKGTKKYADQVAATASDAVKTELIGTMTGDTKTLGNLQSSIATEEAARAAADSTLTTNLAAVSAVTATAIQKAKLGTIADGAANITTQNGAKIAYTAGDTITLDLTSLVIDCGEF